MLHQDGNILLVHVSIPIKIAVNKQGYLVAWNAIPQKRKGGSGSHASRGNPSTFKISYYQFPVILQIRLDLGQCASRLYTGHHPGLFINAVNLAGNQPGILPAGGGIGRA